MFLRQSVHPSSPRRVGIMACLTALTVIAGGALLVAGSSGAGGAESTPAVFTPNVAQFANCPVNVAGLATCLYSSTTSTTFEIGSTTITSSAPTTLSLGLRYSKSGQPIVVLPDNGTQALQSPAVPVPGGFTVIGALGGGALAVTATPQLVGLPTVSLANLLGGNGPGLILPIDVLISTPTGLLGPDCTLGDASDPITLNLTTGTTNPPSPNTPITGSPGTTSSTPRGLITVQGMTLVDNSFAVPGAHNCGPNGVLDSIVNLQKGLPSAAGSNTAILSGSSYTAPAKLVRKHLG
jgi:hypothetical protein